MKPKISKSIKSKAYQQLSRAQLFVCILSLSLVCACTTIEQKKQFEQVQVGMDKGQVLEIMDSPQRTERHHGQDRWTYFIQNSEAQNPIQQEQQLEKQIYFENGKSTYVGDPIKPLISAETQDRINEEQNIALQNAAAASRKKTETPDSARSTDKKQKPESRSTQSTTELPEPTYLPQYAPVQ